MHLCNGVILGGHPAQFYFQPRVLSFGVHNGSYSPTYVGLHHYKGPKYYVEMPGLTIQDLRRRNI